MSLKLRSSPPSRFLSGLLLLLAAIPALAAETTQTAAGSACIQAYNANNNDELDQVCAAAAKQGDYVAAFVLGNLLAAETQRLPMDRKRAYELYAEAAKAARAERDQPRAQWILGVLTINGRGTRKDIGFGLEQLWQAARANYAPAFRQLGLLYSSGISFTRYAHGEDIPKNEAKAFQYFLRAAQQGDVSSQQQLAHAHQHGLGTPVDRVKAYAWYALLASGGDGYSQKQLALLKPKLSAKQLSRAESLSASFAKAYGTGKGLYDF